MDEQILRLVIGCDEPEARLVAEPLYGSGSHCFPPALVVLRTRRLLSKGYERWHCDVGRTTQPDVSTVAAATISARLAPEHRIRRPAARGGLRPVRRPAARSAAGSAARPRLRGRSAGRAGL